MQTWMVDILVAGCDIKFYDVRIRRSTQTN